MLSKMTTVAWNTHWGQDMVGSLQRLCLVFPSRRQRRQRSRAGDHVPATAQVGRWELPWWMSPPNPSSPAGIALGAEQIAQTKPWWVSLELFFPLQGNLKFSNHVSKSRWKKTSVIQLCGQQNQQGLFSYGFMTFNSSPSTPSSFPYPPPLWQGELHHVLLLVWSYMFADGLDSRPVVLDSNYMAELNSPLALIDIIFRFLFYLASFHETCWKGRSLRFLLQYETEFELANIGNYYYF